MENVNYTMKYSNDDKKLAKVICLAFCIFLDLIVLSGVIASISTEKYIDLIIYAAVFVVALAIRCASIFFTYEIVIGYQNGNVTIKKKYPIKELLLFNGQARQLELKRYDGCQAISGKKCVRLCSKSCVANVYMVELLQRKCLIYLDDYLFSLIEVSSDLS